MNISIVHDDPAFVTCKRCEGKGYPTPPPGLDPDYCVECSGHGEIALDLSDLATLAHNLAWAAGLCASFEMGRDAGPDTHVPLKTSWWRPGCGKPWSWPHITRDDQPGRVHSQTVVERGNGER